MYSLLFIDADTAHSNRMATYLRSRGCKVSICGNLNVGIGQARHSQPDLIVLDEFRSEQSGLEALRQMRRDPSTASIPVIVVASRGHAATKVRALWQGAQDYLVKPVRPQELWWLALQLIEGQVTESGTAG